VDDDHILDGSFGSITGNVREYAIVLLDVEGRVASWNRGAERINGYAAAEIIGQHFSRFYLPEEIAWGKPKHLLQVAGKQGHVEDEGWRLRKDGTRFWASAVITAWHDNGTLRGFFKITRDMTERRLREQSLKDHEARLRNIVNQAVDGIITIDERGTIESVNPAVERIFGYAGDELIGKNVRLLMPNPYHDEHDAYLDNYRRTGEKKIIGIGREVLGRRRDGSIFPVDLAVSEVQLGDRRLFTGIVRDITDRKRGEQALRDSEARHRSILEAALDCIISMDGKGRVIDWNPAAERCFGYTRDEAVGREMAELIIPPSMRAAHRAGLARYLNTGEGPVLGKRLELSGIRHHRRARNDRVSEPGHRAPVRLPGGRACRKERQIAHALAISGAA
jgi:PAS domain S-box-containing protein